MLHIHMNNLSFFAYFLFIVYSFAPYSCQSFPLISINANDSILNSRCHTKIPASSSFQKIDNIQLLHYAKRNLLPHLYAKKRNKNDQAKMDLDQFNQWYDEVDDNATPDDVFWEEMERRKSISSATNDSSSTTTSSSSSSSSPVDPFRSLSSSDDTTASGTSSSSSWNVNGGSSGGNTASSTIRSSSSIGISEERSMESTLAFYSNFMVSDNWLNEEYEQMMVSSSLMDDDEDFDAQNADLERQLDEWEKEIESNNDEDDDDSQFISNSREPWDYWAKDKEEMLEKEEEDERTIKINVAKAKSKFGKQFFIDYDDYDEETESKLAAQEEAAHLSKLSKIKITSPRLENARRNPKAKAFFARKPNEVEGFDTLWCAAIDNACMANLQGSFRNYGVEFADNFGDFQDGCSDDAFQSIEDIASYKARMVYEVTGLPTVASRTSFEIEPARPIIEKGNPSNRIYSSPRVTSGYRFNDVGDHVDYLVDALKPVSDPSRVTRFRSCFCFYDGEMEIFDYGELDCDIYFCNSLRTYIPMSSAINEMSKTLQLTFGFEYQTWLKNKIREVLGSTGNRASISLRDRVLKEGRVLPNEIIDVSSFMDSKVDVNLMDDCAKELSQRFGVLRPTKILTVATTGLVLALPMAKYLQVPVVYARKERSIVMSNTWQAPYSSKTVGKNKELIVSKNHLDPNDRILIVDDFLSSGSSQEALLRIVSDSGAMPVGIGVLLEKVYEAGRQALSGYDIPVESLVRVASVSDGILTLVEEEGYSD